MLGDPAAILLITTCIIAAGLYTSNAQLIIGGLVIPATVTIGAILKILFERARPATEYALNMKLQTFSFPSGHSSGSTAAFGILAYIIGSTAVPPLSLLVVLLVLVPIGVGVSRVYLGAHFPSDVIAGWTLGLVMVLITIFVVRPFV